VLNKNLMNKYMIIKNTIETAIRRDELVLLEIIPIKYTIIAETNDMIKTTLWVDKFFIVQFLKLVIFLNVVIH